MTRKQEPGVFTKMLSTGLGALFLTEEGVRKGLKPLGLPRDASNYLMKQVERRKDEFMQVVRDEMHQALKKVPFESIAKEILATNDIEVTIRFNPRPTKTAKKPTHRWKSKR